MKEIDRLAMLLSEDNIPFEKNETHAYGIEMAGIKYPNSKNFVCSAIQGDYSFGGKENLIEIMGLLTPEEEERDEVVGYLTADEVYKRIKKHWGS